MTPQVELNFFKFSSYGHVEERNYSSTSTCWTFPTYGLRDNVTQYRCLNKVGIWSTPEHNLTTMARPKNEFKWPCSVLLGITVVHGSQEALNQDYRCFVAGGKGMYLARSLGYLGWLAESFVNRWAVLKAGHTKVGWLMTRLKHSLKFLRLNF